MRRTGKKKTKKIKIYIFSDNEFFTIRILNIVMQNIVQIDEILEGIQELRKHLI
jgi:hypothetical protein